MARLLIKHFGACIIPLHCLDPIDDVTKDGPGYVSSYTAINNRHRKERKWFLLRTSKFMKELRETNRAKDSKPRQSKSSKRK